MESFVNLQPLLYSVATVKHGRVVTSTNELAYT